MPSDTRSAPGILHPNTEQIWLKPSSIMERATKALQWMQQFINHKANMLQLIGTRCNEILNGTVEADDRCEQIRLLIWFTVPLVLTLKAYEPTLTSKAMIEIDPTDDNNVQNALLLTKLTHYLDQSLQLLQSLQEAQLVLETNLQEEAHSSNTAHRHDPKRPRAKKAAKPQQHTADSSEPTATDIPPNPKRHRQLTSHLPYESKQRSVSGTSSKNSAQIMLAGRLVQSGTNRMLSGASGNQINHTLKASV